MILLASENIIRTHRDLVENREIYYVQLGKTIFNDRRGANLKYKTAVDQNLFNLFGSAIGVKSEIKAIDAFILEIFYKRSTKLFLLPGCHNDSLDLAR